VNGLRAGSEAPTPTWISVLVVLSLATGCGTMTFKAGASSDAMAVAERDCRQRSSGEDAFAACMRASGYMVATGSAPRDGESAVVDTRREAAAAAELAPTPPTAAAAAAPVGAPPAKPAAAPVRTDAIETAVREDSSGRVAIASWWKLGAGAEAFDAAVAVCVDELGDAHRPDPGVTTVSLGLRGCLMEAGWRPLGESALP